MFNRLSEQELENITITEGNLKAEMASLKRILNFGKVGLTMIARLNTLHLDLEAHRGELAKEIKKKATFIRIIDGQINVLKRMIDELSRPNFGSDYSDKKDLIEDANTLIEIANSIIQRSKILEEYIFK